MHVGNGNLWCQLGGLPLNSRTIRPRNSLSSLWGLSSQTKTPSPPDPDGRIRLPAFGEKLKLEREKRAITLEQISLSTKIGTRMLRALEEENFNQLPGGIFNKGFVRAYARHVGIDEDQAVADYMEASGQNAAAQADSEVEEDTPPKKPRELAPSRQIPWGVFAAILLVFALALSLWTRQDKREAQFQSPAPIAQASPSSGVPANPEGTPKEVGAVPSLPAAVKNISTAAPPASTATSAGQFTVVILAREDSWLSIAADGNTVFEDTLTAENQRAIHAQKEVVVRAGNTGALDFVFNGKKLSFQGDYGEVKTITFGPGGLQPNAPPRPVSQ
jgi:cytoskeleton protein RodZ